jgi:hypothetical protein
VLREGSGLVEWLAEVPLRVSSLPMAADSEDSDVVALSAANEPESAEGIVVAEGGARGAGLDRSFDCRHLRDAVCEVAAKRSLQDMHPGPPSRSES